MKKMRILALALSAVMCLALFTACSSDTTSSTSSSASADMVEEGIPQNFILINETGTTINELTVAPAGTENWTDNVLPQDALETDDTCPVDFYSEDMDNMVFDLQTKDTDGNKVIYENVDLSMGIEVTLSTNPDTGAPTADVQ